MSTEIQPALAATVIGEAFEVIRVRHAPRDMVVAAIAGLALVRDAVSQHAGYAALRQYDDWLADQLEALRRRRLRTGGDAAALPEPGSVAWRPTQIVREAVQSCFLLNGHAPGNALLLVASQTLLDGVIEGAGGLPSRDALMAALEAGPERDEEATAPTRPVTIQ